MSWFLLVLAGLLEIGWALGLKYTQGFSRLWPSAATIAAIVASLGLLSLAVRTLPASTAYAVWSGIGIAGTSVLGMLLLGETVSLAKTACVGMILLGIVGLKLLG
jgi:quaternary ammonium compound-resistance protein SugE